jgi:hypothetical protein
MSHSQGKIAAPRHGAVGQTRCPMLLAFAANFLETAKSKKKKRTSRKSLQKNFCKMIVAK